MRPQKYRAGKAGLAQGQAIGIGRNVTRTLGDLPGNICHPTYLADEARELAKKHSKLITKVLTENMPNASLGLLFCVKIKNITLTSRR